MSNETHYDGPSIDNYGVNQGAATPPPVLPREGEGPRYDGPAYNRPAPERYRPPSFVRWIGGLLIVFVVVMLVCGGITTVLAAMTFNSTPASATLDKSFTVTDVPTLVIHSSASSVHINPGSDGQVTLHVSKQVRALTHAQAESQLGNINVTTSQSGNTIDIQEDDSGDFGWHWFNSRKLVLTVTAPANANLSIVEDAGSVDATGFTGKLTTQINAGSATLSNMTMATGSSFRINAGSLDVSGGLQPNTSLNVVVNAGSADLTLPQDTSAHVDATASAGSISVNGWNIQENHDAATTTVNGDLNPDPTGTITIHVSAGSATLNAA
jgi:Toastrack DUF4097